MANDAYLRLTREMATGDLFREPSLVEILAFAPPRKPATVCRNCGNPDIQSGQRCRYCQVITVPGPDQPRHQCPICGQTPRLEHNRDVLRGASIFALLCHSAVRFVTVDYLDKFMETDQLQVYIGTELAAAVDRFATQTHDDEAPWKRSSRT